MAKREFKMTPEQLEKLLISCTPVPMIMLQCGNPPSQQETANRAWDALGKEMGFVGSTATPVPGKSDLYFYAEPV